MPDTPPPLPSLTSWPTFPFEGDIRVRNLDDPAPTEPPRHGENPAECRACSAPDEAYIWVSERWRVRSLDRPTGLPMVLILESRSHLDLGDLPNMLAAELGVMTVRMERAIRSLDGVARVHVNRWGDGSAHLHVWFLARPYGRLQLRGTFLSLWDEILPPISEARWRENLALVAAWLAEFGGRSLAEPPRIDWKAPALLADLPLPVDDNGAVEGGQDDAAAPAVVVDADESDRSDDTAGVPEAVTVAEPDVSAADEETELVPVSGPAPSGSGSSSSVSSGPAGQPSAEAAGAGPAVPDAAGGGVAVESPPVPAQGRAVEDDTGDTANRPRRWRRR